MDYIQIFPLVSHDDALCREYARGYEEGYHAGCKGEEEYCKGYEQGWKDCESNAFYRGIQHAYFFFYRLLNGGREKQKDPSSEAQV